MEAEVLHIITEEHRARLLALVNEEGDLLPSAVVADAKHPDSVLHNLFDWNVERAAERYWTDRAREIIRGIRVIERTGTEVLRYPQYVEKPNKSPGEQGYVRVDALRSDRANKRAVLVAAFELAASHLRRARELAAALQVDETEIDALVLRIIGLRATVDDETPPPPDDAATA